MVQTLADELLRIVDEAATDLWAIAETAAAAKQGPEAWSIKEILGHLVDSAANNHQRFIRAQQVDLFTGPGYDQDVWVRSQDYQSRPWVELVDFWALYNHHLAHVIRHIPEGALNVPCCIGTNDSVTLGFLVQDYLTHLRHHLTQIQERVPG